MCSVLKNIYILILIYLVLIPLTNGISCIVCSSDTSSVCSDPFDSSSLSLIQILNFTYCQVS